MKASIIICSYNKLSRLKATLKSFSQLADKNSFELIICDDGSGYNPCEIINNQLNMKFLSLNHQGLSAARNKGIAAADGDLIIYSDDDLLVDNNFVSRHLKHHIENEHIAVVCKHNILHLTDEEINSVVKNDNSFANIFINSKEDPYAGQLSNIIFKSGLSHHWIRANAGTSIKKDDLIEIGCFDENFIGWGFEDMELGYRLSKNNVSFLYDKNIQLYHLDHDRDRKKMITDIKRNIKYFYHKHNDAYEVEKYWDYLRGKISIKEFDAATFQELSEDSNDEYCYLLMRNKLPDIHNLD